MITNESAVIWKKKDAKDVASLPHCWAHNCVLKPRFETESSLAISTEKE
jgi:hypothetical protein